MKLQNRVYRSVDGHRLIMLRENQVEVLVCQITPRTEAAEAIMMDKALVLEKIACGHYQFEKEGYYNCFSSPLPLIIKKEKPKDSGKPIQTITQITLI